MRQSQLFTRVSRQAPKDEVSKNAQLLIRAGFVHKEMAGVYTFLPLGLRVLEKIKTIIREELNAIGGQEVVMTTLQQKDVWEKTGRWDDGVVDDWFKTDLKNGTKLGLAFTHEEPLTNIMKNFVSSYKQLPVYVYQFQTKFRNEMRAKSGIMRGKEFVMKDLYDFSRDKEEHDVFYEQMKDVYMRIFTRVGLGDRTYLTLSSGGSFSKYSFEFQTITDAGEDVILYDTEKKMAINKDDYSEEIFTDFGLDKESFRFKEAKSVEVGDIYTLGEKYAKALGLTYKNEQGEEKPVYMGSYGIGVPRLMGTIVEVFADDKGLVWPDAIAPFRAHLLSLGQNEQSDRIYQTLTAAGIEVLYHDRDASAGEKLAESDLLGIPYQIILGKRTLESGEVEIKRRSNGSVERVSLESILEYFQTHE
ncbi:MAG: prolyl-tRNA synthetase [Candidatus Moranbacteria bacterium]|jgi:prolyl-tRNA synthetase|nr:prolyl-tRNA synthetase [Candidatus Moranbacteria bacterium]MBP9801206.1 prolyl-tRNA synthetase [Candidatus Moranbacteria bacterium]